MAKFHSDSSTETVTTCIFCLIAHDQDKETEVIKKSKKLVCFRDIVPAAPHHYLVVPKQHIHSCFSLQSRHIHLVEKMAEMGKAVLHDQGITDMKDIRLGFHQPPYTSVDHLHLHVLAPASQIYKDMEYKFILWSDRFVTDEELLCFRDIQPSATHHYLVVPRTHIDNCKCLQGDDIPLVERMVEMGWSVLKKAKVSNLDDVRMGFHLPPFSSVPHLHLHALAPASEMSFKSQLRYGPQSHWFITVDKVLSQLKSHGKVK
ncbi:uncharacterized protein LOC142942316 isoform X2 [Anarhichas minor]|uniref:uncharacterized protein LOC142942316 isoform X2 n=1 Tax=Anarhichas minor TaxID=65739 RepID=UPI003F74014B